MCVICDKGFSRASTLKNHIVGIHEKKKKFKCSICEAGFVTKNEKNNHETIHSKEPEIVCPICEAHFSQPTALSKHVNRRKHKLVP